MKLSLISPILFFILLPLANCSTFQLSRHENFWDWYKGKPGISNTLGIDMTYMSNGVICQDKPVLPYRVVLGERHPIYLHFRILEIIWNPQGGLYYPESMFDCNRLRKGQGLGTHREYDNMGRHKNRQIIPDGSLYGGAQGLIDTLIPYRTYTAYDSDTSKKVLSTIFGSLVEFVNLVNQLMIDIPVYIGNDIIKIPMTPIAGVYFAFQNQRELSYRNSYPIKFLCDFHENYSKSSDSEEINFKKFELIPNGDYKVLSDFRKAASAKGTPTKLEFYWDNFNQSVNIDSIYREDSLAYLAIRMVDEKVQWLKLTTDTISQFSPDTFDRSYWCSSDWSLRQKIRFSMRISEVDLKKGLLMIESQIGITGIEAGNSLEVFRKNTNQKIGRVKVVKAKFTQIQAKLIDGDLTDINVGDMLKSI